MKWFPGPCNLWCGGLCDNSRWLLSLDCYPLEWEVGIAFFYYYYHYYWYLCVCMCAHVCVCALCVCCVCVRALTTADLIIDLCSCYSFCCFWMFFCMCVIGKKIIKQNQKNTLMLNCYLMTQTVLLMK